MTPVISLPSVDVVLVNWNSGDDLRTCLWTLAETSDKGVLRSVTVVDNASTDDSASALPAAIGQAQMKVLSNADNRGFAAACNQGAAVGRAELLLFMNPDIEAEPNSIRHAVDFLGAPENARVGICGVKLTNREGHVRQSCARFPTPSAVAGRLVGLDRVGVVAPHFLTEWDHESTREVDQVMGAFFLVRRSVFSTLDGFDERFFVFYEEIDFALRAQQAGWSSVFLATARAYHSAEAARSPSAVRQFYFSRSRVLYGHKHFSTWAARLLASATLVVEPLARASLSVARRDWRGLREGLVASRWLWRESGALLSGRDSRRPVQ